MKRFLQMTGPKRKVPTLALPLLGAASIALLVAGCGGGGSKSNAKTSTPTKAMRATVRSTFLLC